MKKYTVDISLDIEASFEGIEAESTYEAGLIAKHMFLENPDLAAYINEPGTVTVWEE